MADPKQSNARVLYNALVEAQNRQRTASGADEQRRAGTDVQAITGELNRLPGYDIGTGAPAGNAVNPPDSAVTRVPQTSSATRSVGNITEDDAMSTILRSAGLIDSATDRQGAALQDQGEQSYQAAVMQAAANRTKADNYQRIQASDHLTAEDPNNIHAQISAALFENDAAYATEKATYDQMAGTSMLDDPLAWINAQLNMGTQAAKVNALAQKDQALQSTFNRAIMMDRDAKAQMLANDGVTQQEIELQRAKAAKAGIDAQVAGLSVQSNQAKISAMSQVINVIENSEMRPIKKRIAALEETKLTDAEEARQLEHAKDVRAAVGLGMEQLPSPSKLAKLSPELRQEFDKYRETGVGSPELIVEMGQGLAKGDTATQYIAAQQVVKGINATMAKLQKDDQSVGKYRGASGFKLLREQAKTDYYDSVINSISDPSADAPGILHPEQELRLNPYKIDQPNFIADIVKKSQAGVPAPVSSDNLMVKLGFQLTKFHSSINQNTGNWTVQNEAELIARAAEMQASGLWKDAQGSKLPDAAVAQQIVDYYKAGVDWQAQRNGTAAMGFAMPERYRAQLSLPKSPYYADETINKANVNLIDRASVQSWLTQYSKQRAMATDYETNFSKQLDSSARFVIGF